MIHVGKNIRWMLKRKKKSARALSKYLKISETHIHNILNNANPKSHTVIKVAKFFQEPVWILFEENIESSINKRKEPKTKETMELEKLRKENKLLMELIQLKMS